MNRRTRPHSTVGEQTPELPGLPAYVTPGLRVVLVGINPGLISARQGRYFARSTSRFWPAVSRSRLSAPVRAALGRDSLGPEDDWLLPWYGIGLTDLAARPTGNAGQLGREELAQGATDLRRRLAGCRPAAAAFHGLTCFRAFARYGLGVVGTDWTLGPQPVSSDGIPLFVVPNPSPANAHFQPGDYVVWYDKLADFLDSLPHAP